MSNSLWNIEIVKFSMKHRKLKKKGFVNVNVNVNVNACEDVEFPMKHRE